MSEIGENLALVNEINHNNALLDSRLVGIELRDRNGVITATLEFEPRKTAYENNLILCFSDVKAFDFYYCEGMIFYYLERYKLFVNKKMQVYFSMDPYDESSVESDEDRGVIVALRVSGRLSSS
jgi:hypothetical protein